MFHLTDRGPKMGMFSTEDNENKLGPEKPKRLVLKGLRSGTRNKVIAGKGTVALEFHEDKSLVVEFETEEDLKAFEDTIKDDEIKVEEDVLRYTQRLRPPPKYEGLDTTLFRYELEKEKHRFLTSRSQVIPYGVSRIFNGTLPEPSYLPKTINKPICVIDTGFDTTHPDLLNINVTSADGQYMEDCGEYHGTHISGTIVAEDNSMGIVGIFPGAPIIVVKAFSGPYCWYGYDQGIYATAVVNAAHACVDNGAKIINMSLGGVGHLTAEQDQLDSLSQQGILLFAASGNTGDYTVTYPAAYDSVVSVAAVDENDQRVMFSTYNLGVDLAAPGKAILSTVGEASLRALTLSQKLYAIKLMGMSIELPSDGIYEKACLCNTTTCPQNCDGRICLIARGDTSFDAKGTECENRGGIAAIIYNYPELEFTGGTLPENHTLSIPVFDVTGATGTSIISNFEEEAMLDIPSEGVPYDFYDGTSMATPHVSGVAYLLWNKYPSCSADQIKAALFSGAKDLEFEGRDLFTGYGLVQYWGAAAALDEMNCHPQESTSSSTASTSLSAPETDTSTGIKDQSSPPSL